MHACTLEDALGSKKTSFTFRRRGQFVLKISCLISSYFFRAIHFQRTERSLAFIAAALILLPSFLSAQSQSPSAKKPVESEVAVISGGSFGAIHVFAFGGDRRINTIGFEYDRNSWGKFLNARVDYVGEILPVVLLNEPASYGPDSRPLPGTTGRQEQYGAGISPIGVRLRWKPYHSWQPYLIGKGGVIYYQNRVLSPLATRLNFSAQFGGGFERPVSQRLNFRFGYSDFHFSNGDITGRNPGIDFMYINAGLSYRLGK
jgi:hypothetical protein